MIFKGFRFGMLLQLAIGPMCLLVFNTAAKSSFFDAILLVLAIALIDALYIFLSGLGISAILNKPHIKKAVKYFGAFVLVLFGFNMSLSVFGLSLLPQVNLFQSVSATTVFIQGLLLTLSNPLTIIFWSGVFSTQVVEHNYNRQQLALFGTGCVLATVIFLSCVAFCGKFIGAFLNDWALNLLNFSVGIIISFFGVRLAMNRR